MQRPARTILALFTALNPTQTPVVRRLAVLIERRGIVQAVKDLEAVERLDRGDTFAIISKKSHLRPTK